MTAGHTLADRSQLRWPPPAEHPPGFHMTNPAPGEGRTTSPPVQATPCPLHTRSPPLCHLLPSALDPDPLTAATVVTLQRDDRTVRPARGRDQRRTHATAAAMTPPEHPRQDTQASRRGPTSDPTSQPQQGVADVRGDSGLVYRAEFAPDSGRTCNC
jgi:hypothetical protein